MLTVAERHQVREIRARRRSLTRKISQLCFLAGEDAHVIVLRKVVRALDVEEDRLFDSAAYRSAARVGAV